MEVTHKGYLWVEELVPIYIELIAYITRHPSQGENPTQYLDDKTKKKALVEEMKKTYGTKRGSCRIIIKCISDTAIRLATKLMVCKFLKKFPKEEVYARVVATAAQCTEGTVLSWALYLLNLFLEDFKDEQDLGTEFHYSWLLILIAFIG
jgi:hypothetical protein